MSVVDGRKMDVDDAKNRRGKFMSDKEFDKLISSKCNELFGDIRTLKFSWKEQDNGKKKLMSRLPNGKVVFVDHNEELDSVIPGVPYICSVYERDSEAFAKIICEEYEPKIYILPNRLVHEVWRDEKGTIRRKAPHGNSYEERAVSALKEMENRGFPSVRIVFRGNEMKKERSKS